MTMQIGRQIIYWLLVLGGLAWLSARLNRRKILVLVYHGVHSGHADPVLNFDGMHVRERRFARQMRSTLRPSLRAARGPRLPARHGPPPAPPAPCIPVESPRPNRHCGAL